MKTYESNPSGPASVVSTNVCAIGGAHPSLSMHSRVFNATWRATKILTHKRCAHALVAVARALSSVMMLDNVGTNCTRPVANPSLKDPGIIKLNVSGVHDRYNKNPYSAHTGANIHNDATRACARALASPQLGVAATLHPTTHASVYTVVAHHANSSTPLIARTAPRIGDVFARTVRVVVSARRPTDIDIDIDIVVTLLALARARIARPTHRTSTVRVIVIEVVVIEVAPIVLGPGRPSSSAVVDNAPNVHVTSRRVQASPPGVDA